MDDCLSWGAHCGQKADVVSPEYIDDGKGIPDVGVQQLQEVLHLLRHLRRKHDEASYAIEFALASLMGPSGGEANHHTAGPHLDKSCGVARDYFGEDGHKLHKTECGLVPVARVLPDEGAQQEPKEVKLPSGTVDLMPMKSGVTSHGRMISLIQDAQDCASRLRWSHFEVILQEHGPFTWLSILADSLLRWRRFEFLMGVCILVNSICIGIETQEALLYGTVPPVVEVLEHCFLVIYIFELIVRLLARGLKECFTDGWFIFDFTLVATGAFATWVLQPDHSATSGSDAGGQFVSQLMVFRTCRLLRMLRALRMVKQFRSIWRLVYGLLTSFNTMISTLSLVALVLYIFACLGVELITKDTVLNDPEYPDINLIVETCFKDLFVTLLFLVQFVTLDSVAAVYMPLIKMKPMLAIYFTAVLLVVSISLMNLVMAKIVEGALDAAHQDGELEREHKKEQIRAMVPLLVDLFQQLDSDGSGTVELGEFMQLSRIPEELKDILDMDSMMEVFEMLDVDHSGEVSQDEFIEGILQIQCSDVPIQTLQILKMLRGLREHIASLQDLIPMRPGAFPDNQEKRKNSRISIATARRTSTLKGKVTHTRS